MSKRIAELHILHKLVSLNQDFERRSNDFENLLPCQTWGSQVMANMVNSLIHPTGKVGNNLTSFHSYLNRGLDKCTLQTVTLDRFSAKITLWFHVLKPCLHSKHKATRNKYEQSKLKRNSCIKKKRNQHLSTSTIPTLPHTQTTLQKKIVSCTAYM